MNELKQTDQSRCAPIFEPLENRQMLSGEPWTAAAKLIGQDKAAANYSWLTGSGESVAVIDSGVDYNHPSLGGGFGSGHKVIAGWDFQGNDGNPMSDSYAHGTGIAGVLAADPYVYKGLRAQGIAPDLNIIALRENNTNGVKAALEWVKANRTKYNIVAINMTDFGGGSALIYKDVLKELIADGVFISHAAGNAGAGTPVSKALDVSDYSVGSVDSSGKISSFSQRGAELDMLAPGQHVTIPYYDTGSKKHIYVDTADGTSFASPAVVGTAALIKQIDPRLSPAQIMSIIQDSGVPTYDSVSNRTYKRLNVNAALGLAYSRKNGTPVPPDSTGPVKVKSPFSGTPVSIGNDTTLQFENFDNGGEGLGYHDTDSSNIGGSTYRKGEGVDVQGISGGQAVGFTKTGEWMDYSVNVAASGTYTFASRVSSLGAGGKFHVEVDGVNKTGSISVTDTKNWNTYVTISKSGITLTAGKHTIRIKMESQGKAGFTGNMDWFKFTKSGTTSTTGSTGSTVTATGPISLTASKYTAMSGVTNKTTYIGDLNTGDWVEYAGVDFGTGKSVFSAGVAVLASNAGKRIQIRVGSPTGQIIGTLKVTSTGSWTTYKTETTSLTKVTGKQNVYLTFLDGTGVANIQWIRFS